MVVLWMVQETEEYEYYLQSGLGLCQLANKVFPLASIQTDQLKVYSQLLKLFMKSSMFQREVEQMKAIRTKDL